jgi:WXG100 family type VII secretion target
MRDGFRADLDELAEVIGCLAAGHAELEMFAARRVRDLADLHAAWDGRGAQAHLAAQARWDDGFAAMREALADLRAVASAARSNYAAAASANRSHWGRLL